MGVVDDLIDDRTVLTPPQVGEGRKSGNHICRP